MLDIVRRTRFEKYDKGWAYKGRRGVVTFTREPHTIIYHYASKDNGGYGNCQFLDGLPCDTHVEDYDGEFPTDLESYLHGLYENFFESTGE